LVGLAGLSSVLARWSIPPKPERRLRGGLYGIVRVDCRRIIRIAPACGGNQERGLGLFRGSVNSGAPLHSKFVELYFYAPGE
jgi:hypothetical protein